MATPRLLPLSRQGIWLRWAALGLALVPLVGSVGYGYWWPMAGGDCSFQATYGFFGPGCGLTRAFVAIAQGKLLTAIQFHLFAPALFSLFGAMLFQSSVELLRRRPLPQRWSLSERLRSNPCPAVALTLGMLVYYGLRLLSRYGAEALPLALQRTAVWQFMAAGANLL